MKSIKFIFFKLDFKKSLIYNFHSNKSETERRKEKMPKNKLDAVNFCKLLDMFGEEAAQDTLNDVNSGVISEDTLEKYLYDESETKEQYSKRLKK